MHTNSDDIAGITDEMHIVVFNIDDQQFALPVRNVTRVVNAVEIRFLPGAPEVISGIINVRGQILPVIDMRGKLGLTPRETSPDDRLIIANTGKREVAILADSVPGLRSIKTSQQEWSEEATRTSQYLKGVIKTGDGLILIFDLERYLNPDEELLLERALKRKKR